jgi:hypothetical protein
MLNELLTKRKPVQLDGVEIAIVVRTVRNVNLNCHSSQCFE